MLTLPPATLNDGLCQRSRVADPPHARQRNAWRRRKGVERGTWISSKWPGFWKCHPASATRPSARVKDGVGSARRKSTLLPSEPIARSQEKARRPTSAKPSQTPNRICSLNFHGPDGRGEDRLRRRGPAGLLGVRQDVVKAQRTTSGKRASVLDVRGQLGMRYRRIREARCRKDCICQLANFTCREVTNEGRKCIEYVKGCNVMVLAQRCQFIRQL